MTRGIHLKELKTTDLELLGLPDEGGGERRGSRPSLLSEADPALCQVVGEVRETLESALQLLEEALRVREGNAPSTAHGKRA